MAQYKNYAGDLITCPKQEGTCWQPEHLTKAQVKIMRNKNSEAFIDAAYTGIDGGSSYVAYDSYEMHMRNYGDKADVFERPQNPVGASIFDSAKEALGEETNVIVRDAVSTSSNEGTVVFGTAEDKEGLCDGVKYSYVNNNGEVKFFKKKMFSSKEVTPSMIQEDIAKARKVYNQVQNSRSASSG